MAQACNPSTGVAETGGLPQISGKPGLHTENLFQNQNKPRCKCSCYQKDILGRGMERLKKKKKEHVGLGGEGSVGEPQSPCWERKGWGWGGGEVLHTCNPALRRWRPADLQSSLVSQPV